MSDLERFLLAVTDQSCKYEIRLLPPMRSKTNQWYWYPGMIDYEFDTIKERNEKQDVYFGVNPRDEERGTADAISTSVVIVADFDHTTPDAAMKTIADAGFPEPTALVNSGHGAHAYWRTDEPIDIQQWKSLQRGLIARLGCDEKVKDPPRIMRLPGTKHVAKHKAGEEPTWCTLVFAEPDRTYPAADLAALMPEEEVIADYDAPALPDGAKAKLPHWASSFLVNGTAEGNRNQTAFDVACVMSANGWPVEDAERMIVAAAEMCEPALGQGEALAAVRSAYSKPRTPPAPDTSHLPAMTAMQILAAASSPPSEPAPEGGAWQTYGEPIGGVGGRPVYTSVLESVNQDGEPIAFAKHIDDLTRGLHEITGGWPRRAGGVLFVPGRQAKPGELPTSDAIRQLAKPDDLFAWVQSKTSLYWPDSKKCVDPNHRSPRSAVRRNEFFAHLRDTVSPSYTAAETLPHYPVAEGVWYAPCTIKRSGTAILDEFCDRMNWQTHLDRSLLKAACLTLFWGGPCGARPAFVVTSRHGAGAGKSTTVNMICELVGGRIEMLEKEPIDQFTKRMLSDEGMQARAVLLDNVKTSMGSQGIESMITAQQIGGHKMYVGHATKENRLTWFVTANTPRMSHDLAERSYNIQIGAQRTDAAWLSDFGEWTRSHRAELISACIETLAGPDVCQIEVRDRWAAWQAGVLSKVERGDEIAAQMAGRRAEMDQDRDDADDIANVVRGLIRHDLPFGSDRSPERMLVWISQAVLAQAYQLAAGENDKSRRQTISFIRNRVGNGALKNLREQKNRGERGFAWLGEELAEVPNSYDMKIGRFSPELQPSDLRPNHEEATS